jgi:hypothetical protein
MPSIKAVESDIGADDMHHCDATIHPPIRWPGFDPERAFVLPLQDRLMDTPFGEACTIDGVQLQRKSEFHVTVLDRSMSRAAAAACGTARLRALYEALDWVPRRTGRYVLLHENRQREHGAPESWSLIEYLQLPAMLAFRTALAAAAGAAFGDPVPHVTHFVHGDPHGIGVPDTRALAALRVHDVIP